MLPHRHNPDPDPRRRVQLAQRTAGPSGGQAGRARPSVSDFGSGLGAAILRQLRSEAVRRGDWTPRQHV